jgi:hypothetical protein
MPRTAARRAAVLLALAALAGAGPACKKGGFLPGMARTRKRAEALAGDDAMGRLGQPATRAAAVRVCPRTARGSPPPHDASQGGSAVTVSTEPAGWVSSSRPVAPTVAARVRPSRPPPT